MKKREEFGITLIALVITIIILLILAGVTIVGITGENGIIKNAKEAKVQSEIGAEKDIIDVSVVQAIGENERGNLEKIEYENRLKKNSKKEPTNVFEDSGYIITEFINKNRFYQVDKEGNVEGPIEKIEDEFAGDITKGGSCDGTPEKPYEINCIEDLVAFSQNVNNGNNYQDKNVILTRTLDFNSIFSYQDYKTNKYDIYLGGNGNEELKKQLTNEGNGFVPIGSDVLSYQEEKKFVGEFNGNGFGIKNIYMRDIKEKQNLYAGYGLFGINKGIIKNIELSGKIISEGYRSYRSYLWEK